MSRPIKLVGVDCGSTTTRLIVARAQLTTGAAGRVEISDVQTEFTSPVMFTPFAADDSIDAVTISGWLDDWLREAGTRAEDIFGGGALITGLAAERENAAAVAALVEARMSEAIVATANSPRLESWLAFMGNCHRLSLENPTTPIVNVDIGGGTTNLAAGVAGEVVATGCLNVGARHFQFVPGTYQVAKLSKYAQAISDAWHLDLRVGEALSPSAVAKIVDFYVTQIVNAVHGTAPTADDALATLHVPLPFRLPTFEQPPVVMLSGGVGHWVHEVQNGQPHRGISECGDLGGELARALAEAKELKLKAPAADLQSVGADRATVFGLLAHSTEVSGSTIYLPHPERLPLANVPIVGAVSPLDKEHELRAALELAAACTPAGCLRVRLDIQDAASVRTLGEALARLLAEKPLPEGRTLVLLVGPNLGKVLGNYVTRFGTQEVDLIVVDEVPDGDAQFVRLGRMREGVVPLWLYATS